MNKIGRIALGICAAIAVFYIAFYAAVNQVEISTTDLAERCAKSHLQWLSYQEDIKGQIGAQAAAAWKGNPVRAALKGREATVTFAVSGPWTEYPCGIPVLLRDPLGNVFQSSSVSGPGAERTYTFTLPSEFPPPWIEIHYPHQERRLPLSPTGEWTAASE